MASTLQKTVALKVISAKNLPRLRRDPRVALFIGVPEVCGYTHGFRLRGLQSPRVDFGRGFSGGVPVPSAGAANPAGPEKVRDLGAAAESSGAAPRPSEGLPTLLFTSPPPEGSAPSPGSGPGRSAHHPLGALRCLWRGSESSPTGGPPGRWGHRLASATQRFQQRFRGLRHRFPLDWALVLALKREQPAGSGRGGRRPWPWLRSRLRLLLLSLGLALLKANLLPLLALGLLLLPSGLALAALVVSRSPAAEGRLEQLRSRWNLGLDRLLLLLGAGLLLLPFGGGVSSADGTGLIHFDLPPGEHPQPRPQFQPPRRAWAAALVDPAAEDRFQLDWQRAQQSADNYRASLGGRLEHLLGSPRGVLLLGDLGGIAAGLLLRRSLRHEPGCPGEVGPLELSLDPRWTGAGLLLLLSLGLQLPLQDLQDQWARDSAWDVDLEGPPDPAMLPDPRPRSLAFRRPLFCVVHTLLPSLLLGLGLGGVGCGCSSLLLPDSLLLPLCSPEQLQRSELLRSLQPRLEFTLGRGGGFSFPGVYLSVGEQPTYKPSANPGILLEGRRIYPRLAPP